MKPKSQAQGYILRRSMMFIPLGADSPVNVWAFIPLLMEWKLRIF